MSGAIEKSLSNGTTTAVTGIVDSSNNGLPSFQQGLQSTADLQKYLAFLSTIMVVDDNFEPLLKTTDQELLIRIGKSIAIGKILHKRLESSFQTWQTAAIEKLLKVLDHIPFEIETLAKNSLGFLIKDIKREAISRDHTLLIEKTSLLIDKWKEMQKRNTLNVNGKREMSEQSPQSNGSTNELARKQLKLAIQKEPPTRPKAMADPNFFSNLKEMKKITPSTRPVYHVDRILENISKTDKNETSGTGLRKTLVNSSSAYSATGSSDSTGVKRSAFSEISLSTKVPDPNRKRVRFKQDLVEIREYERNPEEWTSFDIPEEMNQYNRNMDTVDGIHYNRAPPVPQIPWYTPHELVFDADANPNLVIPKLVRSPEAMEQEKREKRALAATYISLQHIPPAPEEPDEPYHANEDNNVPIIPLTDIDVSTASTVTVPSPTATAPNIDVAAAIAAAIKEPQHTQQHYSMQAGPTNTGYYSSPPYAPSAQVNQTPLPTAASLQSLPSQSTATVSPKPAQPEITNQAVENMLKNTPGIMQQLKQLSFLANGGTFGAVNNNPQPVAQPATHVQPVVHSQPIAHPQPVAHPQPIAHIQPAMHVQPTMNSEPQMPYHQSQANYTGQQIQYKSHYQAPAQPSNWDRPNEAYNNNQMANRNKKPKRLPKKNARGNGRPPCNFFYTPEGCRNGDNCPFGH